MGPLASAMQRAKVDGYVQAARASGVKVLAGGVLPKVSRVYLGHSGMLCFFLLSETGPWLLLPGNSTG
jgi:hypothetical protein